MKLISGPTSYRKDDDDEIKDVPASGEEVLPERDHLQDALTGEDNDKHQVDLVEDVLLLGALVISLHHHGHHVETDEHHDEDVEELL